MPLLVASGCTNVTYAPERGTDAILRRIEKTSRRDRMIASMRSAVKAGCNVSADGVG